MFRFLRNAPVALILSGMATAQAPLPVLTAVQSLRIDGGSEDFSFINWIAVSPSGIIAVLQPRDGRILFYDDAGKRVGSFGRLGAGPGEFRSLGGPAWVVDTLVVSDIGLRRKTYISPTFKLVRNATEPPLQASGSGSDDTPCFKRFARGTVSNPYCARPIHRIAPDSSRAAFVNQSNPPAASAQYVVTMVDNRRSDTVFTRTMTTPAILIPKVAVDSLVERFRDAPTEFKEFWRSSTPRT